MTHDERIEKFQNIKYTKNSNEWEHCTDVREADLYEGMELDDALEIMEILDEFYDKINNKLIEQNHSRISYFTLKSIVQHFHQCGNILEDIEW